MTRTNEPVARHSTPVNRWMMFQGHFRYGMTLLRRDGFGYLVTRTYRFIVDILHSFYQAISFRFI